jgi:hypothetical protein
MGDFCRKKLKAAIYKKFTKHLFFFNKINFTIDLAGKHFAKEQSI